MVSLNSPIPRFLTMGSKRKFGWMRLLAIAFLCVLAVLLLALWNLPRANDITFRGGSLRQWVCAGTNGVDELNAGLGEIGTAAIPTLIDLLKEESWLEKSWMFVWDFIPYGVQRRFPNVQYQSSEAVRRKVLVLLALWGPEARDAEPILRALLAQTKDFQLQIDVLPALAEVGADSTDAVNALTQTLGVRRLQHEAAFALAHLGPAAKPAIPQLIKAIESAPSNLPKSDKPNFETMTLAAIGKEAASAERVLLTAMADADLRAAALHALKAIRPGPDAVSPLIEVLHLENQAEQYLAIETLIPMQPPATAAIPELKRLATNDNPVLRILSAVALAHISGQPGSAVPALLSECKQGRFNPAKHAYWSYHVPNHRFLPPTEFAAAVSVSHRGAAAWWLGEIGPAAAEALSYLNQQLEQNDWEALIAVEAIWKISGQAAPVIPTLVEALKSRPNRRLAIRLLGEIGPAALTAKPALLELRSTSITLRREVTTALEKIEPRKEGSTK